MRSPSEIDLAWELADHATEHLSRSRRSQIYMQIGAGDALIAMEAILYNYLDTGRLPPARLGARVTMHRSLERNVDEPRIRS